MATTDSKELNIKIIVVGDSNVGKSALLNNYLGNEFSKDITPTVGLENKSKIINIRGLKAKVQIWDTAGQEKFNALTQQYFRNADGILLVFDLSNKSSFKHIKEKYKETKQKSGHKSKKILVGNKNDLKDNIKVTQDEIDEFTKGKLQYFETSAKEDYQVKTAFESLINLIVDKKSNDELLADFGIADQPLSLSGSTLINTSKESKKKCCK